MVDNSIFGKEVGYDVPGAYEVWQATESIPVIKGFFIDDLRTMPVEPWERVGGKGVWINLEGTGDTNNTYVSEIPPGGELKPQRCLYEEIIYILSGSGATTIWNEGGVKQIIEWTEGSLFSPPLNTWRQHFNVQGDKPARFLAVTDLPLMMNLFHNIDFIFDNKFVFTDRYSGEEDYFKREVRTYLDGKTWETNFVPDVKGFDQLKYHPARGAGGSSKHFLLSYNTMTAHVAEFHTGTYKKAHRHGPGAHVVILSGKGYSLLWKEGVPMHKIDWHEGSMFVPPNRWFHQHFNTGKKPARYLALRWGSHRFPIGDLARYDSAVKLSIKKGGDQIEYEDESPEIRLTFERELAKEGLTIRM
ncbi:MAG: ethanolamine ammonia lyase-activating protein [Deltaproteobacteria bacterium]|nr:ethanolamine ammonia lyase-activating protein [Deltaproteobacteria bacterium]